MTVAAYGLALEGAGGLPWLDGPAPAHYPRVVLERGGADEVACDVPGRRAILGHDVTDGAAVHPLLGRIGLAFAMADGRDALHAGAVLAGGGAWAVVGAKEDGKSTLLAACAAAGEPILADDVLVLEDGIAYAGPRCLDLREPAAGTDPVRGRHRLALGPAPADAPLAGLLFLAWADGPPELRPLLATDVLGRLRARQDVERFPRDPRVAFDLAALPAFELRRPRDRALLPATAVLVASLGRRAAA